MIVAMWHRWTKDGNFRWLALCLAVLALDMLVGSWLIAWEIRLACEVTGR